MRAKKIIVAVTAALISVFATTVFISCSDDAQDVYVTNAEQSGDLVYKRYESSYGTPDYVHVTWNKKPNSNYTEWDIPGAGTFYKVGSRFYNTSWSDYSNNFKGNPGDSEFYWYRYSGSSEPTYTYRKM